MAFGTLKIILKTKAMGKRYVKTSYIKMQDAELNVFARYVITQLTGNSNFTFRAGTLDQLIAQHTAFDKALGAAIDGGKLLTKKKRDAKKALAATLQYAASVVNLQAENDILKLVSSGFILAKEPTPKGKLPVPKKFKVMHDPEGLGIRLQVAANKNAHVYLFFVGPVTDTYDVELLRPYCSTKRTRYIRNLQPGVKYACRACYLGASEDLSYTSVQYIFTQYI